MLLKTLAEYNAWANLLVFAAMECLPEGEVTKERQTPLKSMVRTLNHIYIIDCIFKSHLEGRPHHFNTRNPAAHPPLHELRDLVKTIDQWYLNYVIALSALELAEPVRFQFIGGGEGLMSRGEMILHVVNHGTYHRGMVADMVHQVPAIPPVTDLTVFLRDAAQNQMRTESDSQVDAYSSQDLGRRE